MTAFDEFYLAHYPAVMGYVRRRTASPDDAADAIAETFATAWRKRDTIPGEARLWLFGVARRVLANQRREDHRRTALAERLRVELATEPRGEPDGDPDAVRAAFARLGDLDREVLSLAGWEGLTTAEIAKVLGCPQGVARVRLHRARKRLARLLDAAHLDLSRYGSRAGSLAKGHR
ncbi:RNA polymerase sigma factor [Herbidospora mongoliensis]|uniref:RNA polymerase sigma factor n=1 Tax=Herbidospora mongoliensis TaxID=688067 RepID=UPI000A8526A8|nr:sigma-70 family RNA polymerase sigma factor [Herbidospora mongoliensis]